MDLKENTKLNEMNKRNQQSVSSISYKLLDRYLSLLLWFNSIHLPKDYIELMKRIKSLWTCSGKKFLVQYLKESMRITQQKLAGQVADKTQGSVRVARSRDGYPSIIPCHLRFQMARKDIVCTRIVLNLLSLYRVISYKGEIKLSSITDPFTGIGSTVSLGEMAFIKNNIIEPLITPIPKGLNNLLALKTAGPNHSTSVLGAPLDAYSYAHENAHLLEPLKVLAQFFKSDIYDILLEEIEWVKDLTPLKPTKLGKLSLKPEAAGKIRVFAIADVWTQSILQPMHHHVFNILKNIKQDGCFDQGKPLELLMENLKTKPDKRVWSYDLSAATDRFPIDFQVQVLTSLYGDKVAYAWKALLTDRDWFLKDQPVRYAVGQPMGVLSSWGVFSLCHHIVIQICWNRLGNNTWFTEYALLGDDIVIADEAVATSYLKMMTIDFGVEINLSKSLFSETGMCEFAKRLVSPEGELSPLGPKNLLLCLKSPSNLPSIFIDGLQKGLSLDASKVKALINSIKSNAVHLTGPQKDSVIWTMLQPFGFIQNEWLGDFGPLRVENSVRNLYVYNEVLINNIEELLSEQMQDEWYEALVKTMTSIHALLSTTYSGFRDTEYNQAFPSMRSLRIEALERYSYLLESKPIIDRDLVPWSDKVHYMYSNISGIISYWLRSVPAFSPLDNCLTLQRRINPRFRKLNSQFFGKLVSRLS
nr:MAG: putative RNA dependent RNA polymerase [Henan forest mitovirus 8]